MRSLNASAAGAFVTPRPYPIRWIVGLGVFAAMGSLPAMHLAAYQDRVWPALIATTALILAVASVVRRTPFVAAAGVIVASTVLQIGYVGIGYSDQVDLARSALERALSGQSPYGVLYTNGAGGQNAFAYGPLAMVTALGGPVLELAASIALLTLVASNRSWLTLCVVAGFPPYIYQAATGLNDYSVSLLLCVGWLALARRPRAGMALIATAAAIKPYAAAWFLPAIGFSGWAAAIWLAGVSFMLWSPVFVWGVASYAESLRLVITAPTPQGWQSNSMQLPWVRVLAIPLSAAGLLVRRWEVSILAGSAAFAAVMFFGAWASLGYWVALLPITGIAVERLWVTRRSRHLVPSTALAQ